MVKRGSALSGSIYKEHFGVTADMTSLSCVALQTVYQECLRMSLTFFLRVSICNTVYICLWFMFVRVFMWVGVLKNVP